MCDPCGEQRAYPVQLKLERRHHPEVAPATTEAPEEVGVLVCTCLQATTVRGYHLRREEVVAGEAVAPHQDAQPAPKGEAADTGAGHDAAGCRQSEPLG